MRGKDLRAKRHVKKGDIVDVVTGREKGKRGKILRVFPDGWVVVEKVNLVKRHTRPGRKVQQGGILEKEGKIHISNIMPIDPKTSRPTRIRHQRLEDGRRVRLSQRSGEMLDTI
ncbi:MAG: 50S ribosomal protein L24 [Nitrospinota bacterium]